MKSTRSKTAAPRLPRRWRTPPPLTRGSESLEGMEILREVGGEVGILLWQAYRNVMFWAAAEQGERGRLFSAEAGRKRQAELGEARIGEELAGPLAAIAEMLVAPDSTSGEAVAQACTGIARWAEEQGHLNTALAYTQAASVAAPRNARLSLAVGKLARRRGEAARAETWFRHTVMISRQIGDWESYSRAYIALGNMLIARGNLPAAGRMHIKALRAARRKGLQQIQGMALHDLFVIADEMGRDEQAEEYARQAFRAYGSGHPSLLGLAHDIAYFWCSAATSRRRSRCSSARALRDRAPRAPDAHGQHRARCGGRRQPRAVPQGVDAGVPDGQGSGPARRGGQRPRWSSRWAPPRWASGTAPSRRARKPWTPRFAWASPRCGSAPRR